MKPPSELEGVCLGLIHKLQPCTAYQVRRALKDSPSSHWQASAGSVYPLLARLEEAALVAAIMDPVRSRMFFLGVLSAPERRRHIGELVHQVERHLEEVIARLERLKGVRKRLASGAD